MREFNIRAKKIDKAEKCNAGSNITALKLIVIMHGTHKHTPKAYKSCMLAWGLHSDIRGSKEIIQFCVE